MPRPGRRWRHLILSTYATWLPGDERGFRDHGHRVHSGGDYKNPPPPGEHAGLARYVRGRAHDPAYLPRDAWAVAGAAIVRTLLDGEHLALALAVSTTHVHALAELPDDVGEVKKIAGWCKWAATRAVRDAFPAEHAKRLWAQGLTYKPVDTREHQLRVYPYILYRQGADAWTWSFREGERDPLRERPGPTGSGVG